eukprot:CAMPEP_0181059126 /NCGR_PEP_ID=MMETSP1070-20121207/21212_1 /TAXON_ID=265543 /ORGANISM="Minutocellus polymorphus, Strain NH13" /LENGTH=30 /DNA_ID= /DNA_START= /DNA_END= /DNA_ORIENTATION=
MLAKSNLAGTIAAAAVSAFSMSVASAAATE